MTVGNNILGSFTKIGNNAMRFLCLGLLLSLYGFPAGAQSGGLDVSTQCSKSKAALYTSAKPTVANPAEDDYDVKHVKINLTVDNLSTNIVGDVTTTAQVVAPGMGQYVFELEDQLTIDSVKVNGQVLTATTIASHVRSVQLPATLPQNTFFTAQVFYHGQPISGTQFLSTGIRKDQSPSWGTDVTYTLSEPYDSKDWWACKQSLQDKIDSADIWITVPSHLKAGANGVLKNVASLPGGFSRYEWKTTIPTAYYLYAFGVAPYTDYSFYIHFPNSTDSMLFQNYVYGDNPQTLPDWKDEIDSVADMILHFSDLLGRYPFWKEKYGHIMAPLGGGMEHQTMTTQGNFTTTLSAHELFHQWFGDLVTCATWKDIWLNEGFASYGEALFVEKFWGLPQRFQLMSDKHNEVLSDPTGTLYVDDTTNEGRIFDGRLTYSKGASVVHSLRFVVNDDTKFFDMLKDYLQQYSHSTATTDQFKNTASQFLQQNLDTFINQWVYGEGYPQYSASWNQVGNVVVVKLDQSVTQNASVNLFYTPLELRLTGAQGDTVIRVHNSQASQYYNFVWNKPMSGLVIDPNDWLLNYDLGTTRDLTLTGATDVWKEQVSVYPNPTNSYWTIRNLPGQAQVQLYDMYGRLLQTADNDGSNQMTVPAEHYPAGVYQLKIKSQETAFSISIVKQ